MRRMIKPIDLKNSLGGSTFISESLARQNLVRAYAWAVPDEEALRVCVKYSPLVEIGAGGGYWANLITQLGGKVHAYDDYQNDRKGDIIPNKEPPLFTTDELE